MLQKELAKRLKARYDTKMDGNGWLEEKPMTYINEKHRARFELAVKNISKTNYALLSALYLLTADKRLWGCCKHHNHWLNARTGGFYGGILTSAVLSSLPNGRLPSFTYGRASDALTFSVLLRIPRLRPPSLPSNIGELRQRKNNQGAETHVFMLAAAGKFSTIID